MPPMNRRNRMFEHMERQGKMPKMSFGGRIEEEEDYEDDADLSSGDYMPHHSSEERDEEEMPHFAEGGMVSDNYDYEMGHADEYDSSGEPHTEDDMEDEHPMEFMSRGGRARKMSRGGMMNRSSFVKSLRRAG